MKRFIALGLTVLILFSFTGCGNDIKLNKEENDLVAEYIAGVLLKYSYEDEWEYQKLRNDALLTPQTSSSANNNSSSVNNNSSSTNSNSSSANNNSAQGGSSVQTQGSGDVMERLSEALGLEGATVKYKSYQVGERYPLDEYAVSVPANKGCRVLALEFDIVNSTGAAVTADTDSKGVSLKLSVGGKTVTASSTLLKNDLLSLSGVSIAANSTYSAVVIFQVPEEAAQNISDLRAEVYINGAAAGQVPGL